MSESSPYALQPLDQYSRRLEENVAPREWVNPTPSGEYNLVVVGGGTAGLVAAAGAAGLGAKVALIERQLLGGDCLNYGCVPSKAVLRGARAWAERSSGAPWGLADERPQGDFSVLMTRMRRLRADLSPHDSADRFRQLGVDVYFGAARFVGPRAVEVAGKRLAFERACIATGARPQLPIVPGLAPVDWRTSESIWSITELPRRILVVGGGPIGCELAQAFARFGSQVTLAQRGGRLLPRDDEAAGRALRERLEADGVRVWTDASVVSGSRRDARPGDLSSYTSSYTSGYTSGYTVEIDRRGAARESLEVDLLLAAVGRVPNVDDLGLDAAQVAISETGVQVDDFLRTTNRRIYAAGDVCSTLQFTHAADAQARLMLQNAFFFGRRRVSRLVIPWCTYTDPEVAHVGLTIDEARERGVKFDTISIPWERLDRAVLDGESTGFLQLLVCAGRDEILGATLVARHAGELIAPIALAMTNRLGLRRVAQTIFPYPTQAEAFKKGADAWNRTRLTPTVRRWFERWFRWRRRS